jgi:membrane protease YdiL (CAAX protease family)
MMPSVASTLPSKYPAKSEAALAVRRAAVFLLICSPLWVAPRAMWQAYPFTLPLVIGLTLLFLRWDRRSAAAIGVDVSWRRLAEFVCGVGAGVLLVAAIALVIALVLPFRWARNPRFDPTLAMWSFASLLYGNSVEELIFRGYSFERLIAGIGHWQAQLVTALLFAVFHIANGWPWQVALVGTTVGSLLFGLVFVRWRSVPAAIGVHVAANWLRDLTLLDPPRSTTFLGPVAPRPWTTGEQFAATVVWDSLTLLACAVLWRSIHRRRLRGASPILKPQSCLDAAVVDLHAADSQTSNPQDESGQQEQAENRAWTGGGSRRRGQQSNQHRSVTVDRRGDGTE